MEWEVGRLQMESESEVAQSCLTLCDPWTVAHKAPLSMGFSSQEYWSGLPLNFMVLHHYGNPPRIHVSW